MRLVAVLGRLVNCGSVSPELYSTDSDEDYIFDTLTVLQSSQVALEFNLQRDTRKPLVLYKYGKILAAHGCLAHLTPAARQQVPHMWFPHSFAAVWRQPALSQALNCTA